ncbi:MAG: GDSL-type esterase/lipase family protein [Lachnospiraceae bacterium]|nr:GDSL-type esterase/lipase family protein [Lachnospiraceae bacterium]
MKKTLRPNEIPELRVLGRTDASRHPLTLFWTASGIEMNVRARELWITVDVDYQLFEPWIDIVIDGCLSQRLMLTKGQSEICVLRVLDGTKVRNVRILRDTQAMSGDRRTRLQILSVTTNGTFEPLPEPAMRLEFIGDSITSGEGCCGAHDENDWIPGVFSCINNYSFMTAEALHAEYRVLSQSGWGIYCGYDGHPDHALPPYYAKVCGLMQGEQHESLGAQLPWDFTQWQPDAVIINLGTNDAGSFSNAGQLIPFTAIKNPMRVNEDGSMNEEDRMAIENAALRFLRLLRACNPHAQLIWALGMLGDQMIPTVRNAIARFKEETGDEKAEFLLLPPTREGEYGSRQHPGLPAHRHAAEVLTARLKELL